MGKCGSTSSEISRNITNSAIATAYTNSAFSCKSNIDAGNETKAEGTCSCRELGIGNSVDCERYQRDQAALQAQICQKALEKQRASGLTDAEITCLCKSGGCNIGINQSSITRSQTNCTSKQNVKTNLKNDFAQQVGDNIKQSMSDVGGLFDSNDNKIALALATRIQENISDSMVETISKTVTTKNKVEAGCGGLNFAVTQYSYYTGVLDVLSQNSVVQDAMNQISQKVQSSIDRKDKGLAGFFSSLVGIIVLVIIAVGLCVAAYFIARAIQRRQRRSRYNS